METEFESISLAALSELDEHWLENSRLRRQLYFLEKKHSTVGEEPGTAKESIRYHKTPFRFLELPREIRDKIYLYALQAPIEARPQRVETMTKTDVFRPPTPGLCLLNSQVHTEANEIMYSKNTFAFYGPHPMLEFLGKIGAANRDLIRSISIWVNFFPIFTFGGPAVLRWVSALTDCGLRKIRSICVQGEPTSKPGERRLMMDPDLERAIKDILLRNKEDGAIRQLQLKGFHLSERKKFPEDWNVVMEQWHPEDDPSPPGAVSPKRPAIIGHYSSIETPE